MGGLGSGVFDHARSLEKSFKDAHCPGDCGGASGCSVWVHLNGRLWDGGEERGLAPENLSRSLEDSVTITEPLMPWTVSAVFMAGTLGVSTVEYAPWALFCYGGPVFSLLIAALYRRTGFGIRRLGEETAT